jgi:hypothetical protein
MSGTIGTERRLAGTASITVDGRTYLLVGDPTYGVSAVRRTTLPGMDGIHGYKDEPIPGFISATLRDVRDLRLEDFNAMTNVSVVLTLNSGKIIAGTGLWTVDAQEVNVTEATFSVRWEGDRVETV